MLIGISGSHIMSFVLAQQQDWAADSLTTAPLGPFQALRNGVTGDEQPNNTPTAEFFMWEHFTTKPFFHPTAEDPKPPLKKFSEIFTPWPSWLIVASTSTFPDPKHDEKLQQLFQVLDGGIQQFESDPAQAVKLLGTGELGCTYIEEDAKEWLKDVKFTKTTRGVDRKVVEGVVDILKVAGVIDSSLDNEAAITRVVGIHR